MAYTKFTQKSLDEAKQKTYNMLTNDLKMDSRVAQQIAQITYEINETFRIEDLEHKKERRKRKVGN